MKGNGGRLLLLPSYFIDMKKCKLLSFDSSTKSTGYALFVNGKYIEKGFCNLSSIKDSETRFIEMVKNIYDLMNKYSPDIVTWEVPVILRNPQTQRDLTMIAGAIAGKCIEDDIFFYSFRPTEWRKLVADADAKLPRKRDELKLWSKAKVKMLYNIDVENDDESDAILIGQAYVNKWGDKNEQ